MTLKKLVYPNLMSKIDRVIEEFPNVVNNSKFHKKFDSKIESNFDCEFFPFEKQKLYSVSYKTAKIIKNFI